MDETSFTKKEKYYLENLEYLQVNERRTTISQKFRLLWRGIQIMLYFLPAALLFPLYYLFEGNVRIEEWCLNTLVWSIESCGSVVIKLAQYASHRPDLVNQKLIQKFKHLR